MKSLSNDDNYNCNNNNWLGFSLSPQMNKMEGAADHPQTLPCSSAVPSSVPLSFSHPPSHHFNYPGIYCGMEGDNAAFYPPVTVMPLKSDGSLCIMEAMNRSQPQGTAQTYLI